MKLFFEYLPRMFGEDGVTTTGLVITLTYQNKYPIYKHGKNPEGVLKGM